MRDLAVALLVAAAAWHGAGRQPRRAGPIGTRGGEPALALWSFLMAAAQGAGSMLVPALVPLCSGATRQARSPRRADGPGIGGRRRSHGAMLLVTGLLAAGVCRGARCSLACSMAAARARGLPRRARAYRCAADGDALTGAETAAADCRSATSLANALSTLDGSEAPSSSISLREAFIAARFAIRRFDSSMTACRVSGVM